MSAGSDDGQGHAAARSAQPRRHQVTSSLTLMSGITHSATLPVAVWGDAHAWARGIGVVGLALAYLLALLKVATHAA